MGLLRKYPFGNLSIDGKKDEANLDLPPHLHDIGWLGNLGAVRTNANGKMGMVFSFEVLSSVLDCNKPKKAFKIIRMTRNGKRWLEIEWRTESEKGNGKPKLCYVTW